MFKLIVPKRLLLFLLILLVMCTAPYRISAQTSEDFKAVLLSKITQYIEWPENANLTDQSKPFIITVIGKNPFGSLLEDLYLSNGQKIKNKYVEIHYIKEIHEIDQCNILFISNSEEKRLMDILYYTKGKPILTISDTKNFGEKGVNINFFISNNRTKFELNETSITNNGFRVDYRLRNIAKIVG